MKNHLGFRDDSACVNLYVTRGFGYSNIRSPEFFDLVWDRIPTVLECDHYASAKRYNLWDGGKVLKRQLKKPMLHLYHFIGIQENGWPKILKLPKNLPTNAATGTSQNMQ